MVPRSTPALALGGLLLASGAAPLTAQANDPSPRTVEVKLVDFGFEPPLITVRPGDHVRFLQSAPSPHNVEFRAVPAGARLSPETLPVLSGELRVGERATAPPRMGPFLVAEGAIYEIVVGEALPPGSYEIICTPHEPLGMTAELVVVESPSEEGGER